MTNILVHQIGARHNYAVPRMLHSGGHLVGFYTDSCSAAGLGAKLDRLTPAVMRKGALGRLLARRVEGVPNELVKCADAALFYQILDRMPGRSLRYPAQYFSERAFDRESSSWSSRNADVAYCMFGYGSSFIEKMRREGVKVVLDMFITPLVYRIIERERKKFSTWEADTSGSVRRIFEQQVLSIAPLVDLWLCPGNNVAYGLQEILGGHARTAVVPYGTGGHYAVRRETVGAQRVLFGGSAILRKGIQYFALAAQILRKRGCRAEFRVVGAVEEAVAQQPVCQELTFVGRVKRAAVADELQRATLLVLPSLAEGCASMVHEAVQASVPVITTKAAGTMVSERVGGWLVREQDPEGLADAIEFALSDERQRIEVVTAASDLRRQMTETAWLSRLMDAFRSL